ncbi:MAG: SpoIIE family protein phosphatase, partial [Verrucomicrobiae bacterium]|nr:SpoIIE family protein phosphatase [Verrucomicrobiae bacterium]
IRALKTLGEYYDLGVAYVFRNHCNWMGVTPLGQALRENEEFIELVREANMLQPLGWALFNKGIFAAFRGDINDEVVKTVQEGHRLMVQLKDLPDVLYSLAFMALVHLRRSDYDNAIDTVGEIEKLLPTHELKASWIQEVFPICSQVYLDTIAHNPDLPEATVAEYLKGAQRFVSKAVSRARRFDFIMGWACQVNGTYWWMRGKKKRAQRAWEQGIKFLRQKENSYRLGYLQLEAARWRLKDDPQDRKAYEYLVEAKDLFQRMDAPRDLKEVNAFLEKMEARNVDVESRSALTFKRHLDSLLSVTQAIGSVFGIEDLLERVVQYAIKVTGAERGFILLRSRDGGPLELRVEKGLDPKWRGKPFSYENFGLSLLLVDEVMRRNEALVSSAADPNPIGQELKSYGVRQAMGIALRTKDKELGVLYLDNRLAEGVFSDEELELMKSFGVQASVSIENSRLVQSLVEQDRLKQEMKLGRDIQQGFLPKQAPEVSGIKVAAFMEPAREIGGDYYDYIVRGDNGSGKFAVVIGDVTGKGVGAGLNMALVKTALRSLTQEPIGWREILVKANKILCKQMAFGTFVTLLGLEWDPNARRVSYSGAGHGEFLVHRRASGLVDVIRCGGTALGLIPDIGAKINEQALAVEPGDRIVLFTDGVTEAPNEADEQFGLERLREAVARFGGATPSELIEKIRGEVATFRGKREQYDDITLIALEIAG